MPNNRINIEIHLDGLDPNAVRVELYAMGVNGAMPMRQEMQRGDRSNSAIYSATVSADRPATDYTARVIPNFEGISIPLESTQIL